MGLFSMSQTASFVGKIFDNKTSTEPVIQMTSFKPSFPWKNAGISLPTCAPEEQKIPSDLIHSFLKTLAEDRTLNMHSITIARNGKILCEAAFGAQRTDVWKYTFSACKSIVSLAIGILIDEGLLDLEDRVVDIFPKEVPAIAKVKLRELTVEDLLTMRSPVAFGEVESAIEENWLKGYFSAPIKGDPGKAFKYNSLNTYLLSAIVVQKADMSLSDFLDAKLFGPLGIDRQSWYWEKCPRGIEKGGWGLYLLAKDFCKLAQLVLQKGSWHGKQLISEAYLDAATTAQVKVTEESALFDYGYQIWVGKHTDTFLFNGMLGQNVIAFKNSGIIVVSNAGNDEFFQQSSYFRYLSEFFDKPFDSPCAPAPEALASLKTYIASLSSYTPAPLKKPALWERFQQWFRRPKAPSLRDFDFLDGKIFEYFSGYEKAVGLLPLVLQVVENSYPRGLKCVSFSSEQGKDILTYSENGAVFRLPLGLQSPEITELEFGKNRFLVAVKGAFKTDEEDRRVLVVRVDFLEFPSSRVLKFVFLDEKTVLLRQTEFPGKEFAIETIRENIGDFSDKPMLAGVMDRIGTDFFEFKAERAFSPELILKETKELE